MSTRPTPAPRRALAAAAVVLALGIAGGSAVGLVGPVGPGGPVGPVGAQETEPAPSTEPVPADDGGTPTSTTVAEVDDTSVEDAQAQADADLRSVWMIVAALGAVAFGLLILLILYVRATNPARAAQRRAELAARAEERRRAREERRGVEVAEPADVPEEDERTEAVVAATPVAAATAPAATAPAAAAGAPAAGAPVVGVPPARTAPVLSRDPDDDSEVRVLGAADAAGPTSTEPARPESPSAPVTTGSGAGTRRRAKPLTAPPVGSKVAPAGPPPGPAEGDETVRIVPAPSGPAAVPTSAGAGAVVARTPGAPGAPGDRPPPRSLVDSPPPPRRPRRVEAPAKKLGTADAERVLVRPGQTPVRLPPSMTAPGDAPDEDEDSVEEPDR